MEESSRRELLEKIGATAAITGTAGCLDSINPLVPDAPEINDTARKAERELRSQLPWGSYPLSYNIDSLKVDVQRFGRTGVEDAYQYGVNFGINLDSSSDDMRGYLATEERAEEFFGLLNETTYDMLDKTSENFNDFEPENQPSHLNQVTQYHYRVGGNKCSYVQDTVPSSQIDEILSSRSAYSEHVSEGENLEVVVDDGMFGLGIICESQPDK